MALQQRSVLRCTSSAPIQQRTFQGLFSSTLSDSRDDWSHSRELRKPSVGPRVSQVGNMEINTHEKQEVIQLIAVSKSWAVDLTKATACYLCRKPPRCIRLTGWGRKAAMKTDVSQVSCLSIGHCRCKQQWKKTNSGLFIRNTPHVMTFFF